MSEKKYVVPEVMLKAVTAKLQQTLLRDTGSHELAEVATAAALRWLSENPIVPTREQANLAATEVILRSPRQRHDEIDFAVEWQRRMFLASEPEVSPLVMYIMRHFDDLDCDSESLRNRAETSISDFEEHKKRETRYK